jgi:endonuclease I
MYLDVHYGGLVTTDGCVPDLCLTNERRQMGSRSDDVAFMGVRSALIEWHLADPPDADERRRNDGIEELQGNRNPFVDHPEWVCMWGRVSQNAPRT